MLRKLPVGLFLAAVLLSPSAGRAAQCKDCQARAGAVQTLLPILDSKSAKLVELRRELQGLAYVLNELETLQFSLQMQLCWLLGFPESERDTDWWISVYWLDYRLPQVAGEIATTEAALAAKDREVSDITEDVNMIWLDIQDHNTRMQICNCE